MSDYTLYYWSVPFRGQFVRAVLGWAGKTWDEAGDEAIGALMEGPVKSMPIPFMGPPVLVDHANDFAVSQMPAILLYLGESLDLMPTDPAGRALTLKVVCDANDVIDELTRDGGKSMWTEDRWAEFQPRLEKWMSFWEEIGLRHGLKAKEGFLLGGSEAGLADVATATLWTTIVDRFPAIGETLDRVAPHTAALARQVSALPALVEVAEQARANYGDAWSGGQIEKSLRKVLGD
ncbi:glutathione S-transferase [Brevundimonas staleyi]|uniref:Glutathione S-transferase n=1 Tax=Brevundimonas staleyi TaxID=74326 RepID=A0ABW0FT89_9CAUL